MRVAVTGGSGRAGTEVVRSLGAGGHEVANLDRRPPPAGLPGTFVRTDLSDAGQVYDALAQTRPEVVCHVAANPVPFGQTRLEVFNENVRSTYAVLQAAGDLGAQRVVYASSEMATGLVAEAAVPSRLPFDESERRPSTNAYGLSKYVGEVIADALAARHPGIGVVSLRLSLVVTPDGYDLLSRHRADERLGRADFWSYVDARDVGEAFRLAAEGSTTGHEAFLVAAADQYGTRPLRDLMRDHYDGYDAIDPALPDDASAFDCSKMHATFGWRPRHSWRDHIGPSES